MSDATHTIAPPTDHRRSLLVLLTSFVAVGVLSVMLGAFDEDATATSADQLLDPPAENGVWILGNSIFKTGVDPDGLELLLDGPPVRFEYHGGHYTSLWYLIATNALPEVTEQPDLVVWGFRPAFAALPAYRQNVVNSTELFLVEGDETYERLATGVAAPIRNPLDQIASTLDDQIAEIGIWQARDEAANWLADASLNLGVAMADIVGADAAAQVRSEVIEGDLSVLDLLNQVTTSGEIELAEERIIDGVGDFISGDTATYARSFIPVIAERIDELDLRQLVIIWPTRLRALGDPTDQDDAFVADAVADLEARGIEVLDLYNDQRFLGIGYFAEGDHFNVEGRDLVTAILAGELKARGLVAS